MFTSKTIILTLSALVASTSLAAAYTAHDVDKRQSIQSQRIEQGRKTGKVTWTEGLKLRQEQARIARLEAIYKSDGKLDRQERAHLAKLQNEASKHIYNEAHDGWSRWSLLPRFGR